MSLKFKFSSGITTGTKPPETTNSILNWVNPSVPFAKLLKEFSGLNQFASVALLSKFANVAFLISSIVTKASTPVKTFENRYKAPILSAFPLIRIGVVLKLGAEILAQLGCVFSCVCCSTMSKMPSLSSSSSQKSSTVSPSVEL